MFGTSCEGLGFFLQLVGAGFALFVIIKYAHAFYQRMIVPAKQPLQFGKWGIITGVFLFFLSNYFGLTCVVYAMRRL